MAAFTLLISTIADALSLTELVIVQVRVFMIALLEKMAAH
jgi:hypothetical protein